ncbi:hypothetical protein C5L39_01505 [Corynebacterium alimapuense]|uniref:Uncharacterized protein n=1 Tax=Corynebacterium alimapuense TaxID=1576874 RepID=A0A3M8K9A1_9CORY|nr:hypothetical protein C5L39_01505 [Corynebacterium alimapuense]
MAEMLLVRKLSWIADGSVFGLGSGRLGRRATVDWWSIEASETYFLTSGSIRSLSEQAKYASLTEVELRKYAFA